MRCLQTRTELEPESYVDLIRDFAYRDEEERRIALHLKRARFKILARSSTEASFESEKM